MKKIIMMALTMTALSATAFAGKCAITITRTECPGKKMEAITKPYNNVNPTVEEKDLDQAACKAEFESQKTIKRVPPIGPLAKKVTNVKFDGASIGDFSEDKSSLCK